MTARAPGHRPLLISTGVRASALRTPDKVALSDASREVTYGALVVRLNQIAHMAASLGLHPGDRAALLMPNGIAFMELLIGLSDAGVIAVPINPQATAQEANDICTDAEASALFVHSRMQDRAPSAWPGRTIVIGPEYEALLAAADRTEPTVTVEETDIFSILYTSGTTGRPKGVMLPHRSRTLYMLLAQAANQGRSRPEMRALAVAPIANGAGFINALAPIWFGGSCHLVESFDAETLLRHIAAYRIDTVFLVPTHFHAIFALPPATLARHDVSGLRTIIAGAAALPQATKERIVAHFGEGRLFEGYGSTEMGGVSGLRPEDQLRKLQSVGRPLAGVELRIVDEDGATLPPHEVGEIVCRSPMMFHGYLNDAKATAEVLRDGWYYGGDLGHIDEDGYLYVVDRKKNMIVSGGQNISPREIEEVLHRHPAVAEAAVVGRPDPYWGEAVVAFIVTTPGTEWDADSLKTHCAEVLARYKLPKSFHAVQALPKNANGKVMHRALREMAG